MVDVCNRRTSLSKVFLDLNLDRSSRILDVACGTGIVAAELRQSQFTNIDGLDPVRAYLETAKENRLYQSVYQECVDESKPTSISDDTYDVIICCAGFFQGLISPKAFKELLRITKPGGILMWNIAEGYQHFGKSYQLYDDIIDELVREKKWIFFRPVEKFHKLVFSDSGSAFLGGYQGIGLDGVGFVYTMQKC